MALDALKDSSILFSLQNADKKMPNGLAQFIKNRWGDGSATYSIPLDVMNHSAKTIPMRTEFSLDPFIKGHIESSQAKDLAHGEYRIGRTVYFIIRESVESSQRLAIVIHSRHPSNIVDACRHLIAGTLPPKAKRIKQAKLKGK
jgi:hypothetical protein